MDPTNLGIAFVLGLFSSAHCIGMCGGIAGALGLSLPLEVRQRPFSLLIYAFAYSGGRIASYAVIGALAGAFGAEITAATSPENGHLILRVAAAGFVVAAGLYVAGWFPSFAYLERIGVPLWQKLEPLGRRLLPVRSPLAALAYGAIWGWLPCGLVYSAGLWAASSGGALEGLLILVMFGVGTFPAMMSTTVFSRWLAGLMRGQGARQLIGAAIVVMGIVSLIYAGGAEGNCPTCEIQ